MLNSWVFNCHSFLCNGRFALQSKGAHNWSSEELDQLMKVFSAESTTTQEREREREREREVDFSVFLPFFSSIFLVNECNQMLLYGKKINKEKEKLRKYQLKKQKSSGITNLSFPLCHLCLWFQLHGFEFNFQILPSCNFSLFKLYISL